MKNWKFLATLAVGVLVFLVLVGTIPLPLGTKQKAEISSAPQTTTTVEDNTWYVLRYSGRVGDNGEHINECAKSDLTPAAVMEGARKEGIKYKVVDDVAQSKDGKAHAVSVTMLVDGVERDFMYFKGKDFCLFSSQLLTGRRAHDTSAYR